MSHPNDQKRNGMKQDQHYICVRRQINSARVTKFRLYFDVFQSKVYHLIPASNQVFEGRFWCGFTPSWFNWWREHDWKVSLGWDWNRRPPDPQPDALTSARSSHAFRRFIENSKIFRRQIWTMDRTVVPRQFVNKSDDHRILSQTTLNNGQNSRATFVW